MQETLSATRSLAVKNRRVAASETYSVQSKEIKTSVTDVSTHRMDVFVPVTYFVAK